MKSPAEPEVGPTPSEGTRPEAVARVAGSTADTQWAGTPLSLIFRTFSGVTRDGKISWRYRFRLENEKIFSSVDFHYAFG